MPMDISNIVLMGVIIGMILVVVTMMFPESAQAAFGKSAGQGDVVVTLFSSPDIASQFLGSAYQYAASVAVNGKYVGSFHGNTVSSVDIVPVMLYKGEGVKAKTKTGTYFTVDSKKPEFSDAFSATIISTQTPACYLDAKSYEGTMKAGEEMVLHDLGEFRIRLDSVSRNFIDAAISKLPFVDKGACSALFIASCDKDLRRKSLEKCEPGGTAEKCTSDLSLCGGTLTISVDDVDCSGEAAVKITTEGGTAHDLKDTMYLSFWEKKLAPSCVDESKNYNELKQCAGSFLGESEIKIDLPRCSNA